jgi:hypothetical protein
MKTMAKNRRPARLIFGREPSDCLDFPVLLEYPAPQDN